MKNFTLIVVILISELVLARLNPGRLIESNFNNDLIHYQISVLQNAINEKNGQVLDYLTSDAAVSNDKFLATDFVKELKFSLKI